MKKSYFYLIIGAALMLGTSCTSNDRNGLPPSTGGLSEVLVVMPNTQWETSVGFTLNSILTADLEGLSQPEAIYDPMQIQPADFKGLFEKNRKIIRITISDTVKKDQLVAQHDVFSSPQIIIDLFASTDSAAIRLLKERAESMIEMMKEVERIRIMKAYESTENLVVTGKMKTQFGFKMVLPESFYEAKTDAGFAWYRLEGAKFSQAVLVYTRDFVDSVQLAPSKVITYRNYITKTYIPGELPNSYMSTDTINGMISRIVPFNDGKATEIRGLWKTEGDFMGGPFVNYTFHDKATNKIVTLEGYVYYPNHDKRDLMMQLEAILHSYRKN